MTIDELYQLVK
jgi:hypothetical protein